MLLAPLAHCPVYGSGNGDGMALKDPSVKCMSKHGLNENNPTDS